MNILKKYNVSLKKTKYGSKKGLLFCFYYVKFLIIGFFDFLILGSTVSDFFKYQFYDLSYNEKRKFLTWRYAKKFIKKMDNDELIEKYSSKTSMYSVLKDYVNRGQLFSNNCTYGEYLNFLKKYKTIIYKPDCESCGRGIKKYDCIEINNKEFFNSFIGTRALLDETIVQHPKIDSICDKSVNTLRIVTAKINRKVAIMGAVLRMGNGSSCVDNFNAGGLACEIDLKSGTLIGNAINRDGKKYIKHPYSGVIFNGYTIPKWNEILNYVKKMSLDFPINYCGWDIAIGKNKLFLVEVNPRPMVDVIQAPNKAGKKAIYDKFIKENNL